MKTKTEKTAVAIVISLLVTGLLAGTFFDLNISRALADLKNGSYLSKNPFGRFFETVGETPVYFVCVFSATVTYHYFRRKSGAVKWTGAILSALIVAGLSYYGIYKFFKYIGEHTGSYEKLTSFSAKTCYITAAALNTALAAYFGEKIPESFILRVVKVCFVILLTALFSQVITTLFKKLAGRPRYRAMYVADYNGLSAEGFSLFRRWYEFFGYVRKPSDALIGSGVVASDAYKSFPSGHSSSAAMIIVLNAFPALFPKTDKRWIKITVFAFSALYVLAVMLSRIVVGAHFLSDVVFGTLITVVCFYLSEYIVNRIKPLAAMPGIQQ